MLISDNDTNDIMNRNDSSRTNNNDNQGSTKHEMKAIMITKIIAEVISLISVPTRNNRKRNRKIHHVITIIFFLFIYFFIQLSKNQ